MVLRFLTVERVKQLHADAVRKYGGSKGLRDEGMLESAVAMPMTAFGGSYLHEGIFEMASAYLYHLVQNHPFVDGNKRVGLMQPWYFSNYMECS
jgi:death-on-curing protein